jgi:hypothetical protein
LPDLFSYYSLAILFLDGRDYCRNHKLWGVAMLSSAASEALLNIAQKISALREHTERIQPTVIT